MILQEILGDCGRAAIQTQGSTSNPFGSTFVYGYQNLAFEVNFLFQINVYIPLYSDHSQLWFCFTLYVSFFLCVLLLLYQDLAYLSQVMKNGYIATVTLFQSWWSVWCVASVHFSVFSDIGRHSSKRTVAFSCSCWQLFAFWLQKKIMPSLCVLI